MRPFLKDIKWPGRRIRSGPSLASEPSGEQGRAQAALPVSIVREEHHATIRASFTDAQQALQDLHRVAEDRLRPVLAVPVTNLPLSAEALSVISGTHPSFGVDRPAVPPDDQLTGTDIGYDAFVRAYNTLKYADRGLLGFDASDILSDQFAGTVNPYSTITSPAQAAGEVSIPRSDQQLTIDESIEERVSMRKREIWHMLFLAVISFILRFIGDIFRRVGDNIARSLSFKILGKRIRVGKFVAKPLYALAKVFYKWADQLEARAMGMEPKRDGTNPDVPTETDLFDATGGEDAVFSDDPDGTFQPEEMEPNEADLPLADGRYDASSGQYFLMNAYQVVQAVSNHANRPGNEEVRAALELYEQSRALTDLLENAHQTSHAWGVASGLPSAPVFDLNRAAGGQVTRSDVPPQRRVEPPGEALDVSQDPAFECD